MSREITPSVDPELLRTWTVAGLSRVKHLINSETGSGKWKTLHPESRIRFCFLPGSTWPRSLSFNLFILAKRRG